MSTCISQHGEFGSHELDELHTCTLCHVLDEDGLRAEMERVRTERDDLSLQLSMANGYAEGLYRNELQLTAELEQSRAHFAEALEALKPASAAEDWHREYGHVLVRVMEERDRARAELVARGESLATYANACGQHQRARFEAEAQARKAEDQLRQVRMVKIWRNEDGKDFVFADDLWAITDPELAALVGINPPSSQVAPTISQPWELDEEQAARTEADAVIARVVDAYDNQLEDINRRVEADKEVLAAAEWLVEHWKSEWVGAEDSDAGMFLHDRGLRLYRAVRARAALDAPPAKEPSLGEIAEAAVGRVLEYLDTPAAGEVRTDG